MSWRCRDSLCAKAESNARHISPKAAASLIIFSSPEGIPWSAQIRYFTSFKTERTESMSNKTM